MPWIGGFEVLTTTHSAISSDMAFGAFVNVFVDCETEAEFREKAAEALTDDGYRLIGVEEVIEVDLGNTGLPDVELDLIMSQLADGDTIAYGEFQTFRKDGLDA